MNSKLKLPEYAAVCAASSIAACLLCGPDHGLAVLAATALGFLFSGFAGEYVTDEGKGFLNIMLLAGLYSIADVLIRAFLPNMSGAAGVITSGTLRTLLGLFVVLSFLKNIITGVRAGISLILSTVIFRILYMYVLVPLGTESLSVLVCSVVTAGVSWLTDRCIAGAKHSGIVGNCSSEWGGAEDLPLNVIITIFVLGMVNTAGSVGECVLSALTAGAALAAASVLVYSASCKAEYSDCPDFLRGMPVRLLTAALASLAVTAYLGVKLF